MTNPDYRAELQRLVEAYDEHGGKWPDHHEQALFQAVEDARTALAQPEQVDVSEPFSQGGPEPRRGTTIITYACNDAIAIGGGGGGTCNGNTINQNNY